MLEVYIQEVAALSLQSILPAGVWEHICNIILPAMPPPPWPPLILVSFIVLKPYLILLVYVWGLWFSAAAGGNYRVIILNYAQVALEPKCCCQVLFAITSRACLPARHFRIPVLRYFFLVRVVIALLNINTYSLALIVFGL